MTDDRFRGLPPSETEAIEEAELPVAPFDEPEREPPGRFERLSPMAAISAGATIGGCARYAVGLWTAATWGSGFPWGTLIVNLVGSFVIGCFLTAVTERFEVSPTTRLFVVTGLLGAFTTFSAFSYEVVHLIAQGRTSAAVAYVAASLVGGMVAVLLGIGAAQAL